MPRMRDSNQNVVCFGRLWTFWEDVFVYRKSAALVL